MSGTNDLKNSLDTYRCQLEQVELAILNNNNETEDLLQLKTDLQQLIELTETSLSEQVLDKIEPQVEYSSLDDEFSKFYSEISSDLNNIPDAPESSSSKDNFIDDDSDHQLTDKIYDDTYNENIKSNCDIMGDDSDQISGTKCRLLYGQEWGEMTQYNAVILSCEEIEGELMARVLFCNPTHNSMKPCNYYLDGCCKFEDHECNFSHGYLVSIDELMQYKDPDYSLLDIGSFCLAKDTDNLWYKATVVSVFDDGKIEISYKENGNKAILELQNILPLASNFNEIEGENDDLYSISSSSTDDDIITNANEILYEGEDIMPESSYDIKTSNLLGGWEQFTKGIGSKLLAKMGYITGQGLGRNSDGRAEPVPIELLPQGKSLDKIMEFRERSKNGSFDIFKKGRRKFDVNNTKSIEHKNSVFDFMNSKLNIKFGKERTVRINKKPNSIISISTHELTKKTDKHINVQLLKTADEIIKIGLEINKLNTGLERNIEKNDVIAANKIKQKIAELERYRERLKTSEKFMNQQKLARKARKELVVF